MAFLDYIQSLFDELAGPVKHGLTPDETQMIERVNAALGKPTVDPWCVEVIDLWPRFFRRRYRRLVKRLRRKSVEVREVETVVTQPGDGPVTGRVFDMSELGESFKHLALINAGAYPFAKFYTLTHEGAHVFLGHVPGFVWRTVGMKEADAEIATVIAVRRAYRISLVPFAAAYLWAIKLRPQRFPDRRLARIQEGVEKLTEVLN